MSWTWHIFTKSTFWSKIEVFSISLLTFLIRNHQKPLPWYSNMICKKKKQWLFKLSLRLTMPFFFAKPLFMFENFRVMSHFHSNTSTCVYSAMLTNNYRIDCGWTQNLFYIIILLYVYSMFKHLIKFYLADIL